MEPFFDLFKELGKRTALSYLLPGIIVAWLLLNPIIKMVSQPPIGELVIIPESEIELWVAFFIFAWVAGSILKLIGSLLDKPVYDLFFKRIVKSGRNDLLEKAKPIIHNHLGNDIEWDRFDYFNYAVSYVKKNDIREAVDEINGHIGNSKFSGVWLLLCWAFLVLLSLLTRLS